MADSIDKFYDSLQTVPKLIRDLALGVAEAQRALDHDYLVNLAEFTKVIRSVVSPDPASPIPASEYIALFRAMAPSRHQFTETVAEVHADLQMASSSELSIGGTFGLKAAIFAVAVNASYTQRNAYDFRAAATIKSTMHAISADPGVMEKLVSRAASAPSTELPKDERWMVIAQAFKGLFEQVPNPRLDSIQPDHATEGDGDTTITLAGSGFASGALVQWTAGNVSSEIAATLNADKKLEAKVAAELLKAAATAQVAVKFQAAVSNARPFEIKKK